MPWRCVTAIAVAGGEPCSSRDLHLSSRMSPMLLPLPMSLVLLPLPMSPVLLPFPMSPVLLHFPVQPAGQRTSGARSCETGATAPSISCTKVSDFLIKRQGKRHWRGCHCQLLASLSCLIFKGCV